MISSFSQNQIIQLERIFISMPIRDLIKITFVLSLLLTFPGLAQADAENEGARQKVDGYQVDLVFTAGQPQTGSNELAIKLHDPHGQPLNEAVVNVTIARPDSTSHAEADAAGHQEGAAMEHAMPEATGHGDVDETNHDETPISDPHSSEPSEASSADSHEAGGGGHHGEAETVVAQLMATPAAGHYQGHVDFADTGAWLVKVNFVANGEAREANFVVEAARNSATWWVLSSFLGANALVIATAAVLKRKSVETRRGVKSC
jgi:hypothetical protein